jgi:hypothetical protein
LTQSLFISVGGNHFSWVRNNSNDGHLACVPSALYRQVAYATN